MLVPKKEKGNWNIDPLLTNHFQFVYPAFCSTDTLSLFVSLFVNRKQLQSHHESWSFAKWSIFFPLCRHSLNNTMRLSNSTVNFRSVGSLEKSKQVLGLHPSYSSITVYEWLCELLSGHITCISCLKRDETFDWRRTTSFRGVCAMN